MSNLNDVYAIAANDLLLRKICSVKLDVLFKAGLIDLKDYVAAVVKLKRMR